MPLVQRLRPASPAAWRIAALVVALVCVALLPARTGAAERPLKLVAFGDSLTAGYGVAANEAFPAKLERALRDKGYAVDVINAGVSGDTTSGGLDRLDWSIPEGTDAAIVELGANDALRGVDPSVTRKALDQILGRLKAKGIKVLLAGMRAPPNMGTEYAGRFDAIFPDLAKIHGVALYPFFLEGVAGKRALNQPDGLHPLPAGVDVIVRGILPDVETLLGNPPDKPKS
ncbi:MAG: arylesterase [Variibacter sp.]